MLNDWRAAIRSILRHRATSFAVFISLVLGIGVNVAVFDVVESLLLSPLPYSEPHALLGIQDYRRTGAGQFMTGPEAQVIRSRLSPLGQVAFYQGGMGGRHAVNMRTTFGEFEGFAVESSTFGLLGVRPENGRTLLPADEAAGAAPVVVISDMLWKRAFGGKAIVGTQIQLRGAKATIVGIMPPEFWFPSSDALFWVPLSLESISDRTLSGVIRPTTHTSTAVIQSALTSIGHQLDISSNAGGRRWWRAITLDEARRPSDINFFFVLQAVVLCVLVASSANVSALFMARTIAQRRELLVRAALGASHLQVVRPLLIEATTIVLAAAISGACVARYVVLLIAHELPLSVSQAITTAASTRDLVLFLCLVGLAAAAGCVIGPLRYAGHADLGEALRGDGLGSTGAPAGGRHRAIMVRLQLVTATAVLTVACALVSQLHASQEWTPPFPLEQLYRLDIMSQDSGVRASRFDVVSALSINPAIRAVGAARRLLPVGGVVSSRDGRTSSACVCELVSQDYLGVRGARVIRGRDFRTDDGHGERAIILDSTLARTLFGSLDAVGRRLHLGSPSSTAENGTVVGIVASMSLSPPALSRMPRLGTALILADSVFTAGDEVVIRPIDGFPVESLRSAVAASISGDFRLTSFTSVLESQLAAITSYTVLIGFLGFVAVILTFVGLGGTIGHVVAQRTREIGIRRALGASHSEIASLVGRFAFRVVLPGVVFGSLLGWAAARQVSMSLFTSNTSVLAPLTMSIAGVLLVLVGAVALPTRRALRIPPSVALRE